MTKSKSIDNKKLIPVASSSEVLIPGGIELMPKDAEYFRIDKVAKLLGLTSDDLLHLGATGSAEIMSPIVSGALYEWPVGADGIGFPEVDEPFQMAFDPTDRVILSNRDLAHIEAVGWVIPQYIFAPAKARYLIENNSISLSDALNQDDEYRQESHQFLESKFEMIREGLVTSISTAVSSDKEFSDTQQSDALGGFDKWKLSISNPSVFDAGSPELLELRKLGFGCPWFAVNPIPEDSARTTVEHLFISKAEAIRLINDLPQNDEALARKKRVDQEGKKEHGNATHNSKRRTAILMAALYCLNESIKPRMTATALRTLVEIEARRLWPEDGQPPLKTTVIEQLLSDALKGRIHDV